MHFAWAKRASPGAPVAEQGLPPLNRPDILSRPLLRYGFAALAVIVAFGVRLLFDPFLDDRAPFLIFTPAVLTAAGFGGLGPGLFATVLSVAMGSSFLEGPDTFAFSRSDVTNAILFIVTGVGIAWLGERMRRSRQALEERSEHLRSILDTVPDAMIVIDTHGLIQSFSAAAERLFGYPAAEACGNNVSMLMPSPYREAHDGYMARYLGTGERRIIGIGRIVTGQRRDGTTFPMELSVGEVRRIDGTHLFTGFVRDLTERNEAERRVQELQAELFHLSRLSEMGQMASVLAHELNQPLAAATNYLQAARRLTGSDTAGAAEMIGEAIERAAQQTTRAKEIIQRLRQFVTKGEVEKRPADLPPLIEEAGALALLGAKQHNIAVRYAFGPVTPPALVDRIQLQQVLVNLMRNAVEAMHDSLRRDLTVATTPVADGTMVEITIADTGPGLPEEVSAQLFKPFVTTKPSGMGIGLSICRAIVEAHGGQLRHEPNPKGGAIFRLTVMSASNAATPGLRTGEMV